jgi:hypothetical protein
LLVLDSAWTGWDQVTVIMNTEILIRLRLLLITASVVRFEVFTAVNVKNGVFWDVMA